MTDITDIERIARAMYASIKWGAGEAGWDHAPDGLREHYLALAAVAIKVRLIGEEFKAEPSTIGKGLDDAITDELEHGPKDILK